MIRIKPLTLENGSRILVEVEEADLPNDHDTGDRDDRLDDALHLLRDSIAGLARCVCDSLADSASEGSAPEEWAMEVSIGFKGGNRPIPVVVTGAAAGSLKITAKWKRDERP